MVRQIYLHADNSQCVIYLEAESRCGQRRSPYIMAKGEPSSVLKNIYRGRNLISISYICS